MLEQKRAGNTMEDNLKIIKSPECTWPFYLSEEIKYSQFA